MSDAEPPAPAPAPPVSRRWLLAGLVAGAALPAVAEAPLRSPPPAARPVPDTAPRKFRAAPAADLVAAAGLGGAVGYLVADLQTGLVLEAAGGDVALPPASVAKVITALYALDRLGPAHRFATRLIATGPVAGGRVNGDLVLAGSGDPTLSTDGLAQMAAALKAGGVTGVTGRFRVNGAALPYVPTIDPDQPAHVGYSPAVEGLNLNYNRVHFEWKRGDGSYAINLDARSERFRPRVAVATVQVIDRAAPLFTYADAGGVDAWTVARAALGTGGSRWLPVRRPALYTGQAFRELARAQGIDLPPPEQSSADVRGEAVVTRSSDDLRAVLRDMLRFSTNLTAEVAGLTASTAAGGPVATLAASAARMSGWAAGAYGLRSIRLVDHSGLEAASRIAPADLVRALVLAAPAGALRPILRVMPLRDAQGGEMRSPAVSLAAKTGTLNFVSALAGYATLPGGSDLAFAILCADTARRDRVPHAQREEPPGGADWTRRARRLQHQLIARWAAVYGS